MRQPSLGLTTITVIGLLVGAGVLWGVLADHIDGSPVDGSRPVAVATDSGVVILDRLAFDTLEVGSPTAGPDWEQIARRNGHRFGLCHQQLVRAQDRLRRLGHVYADGRWIRTGTGR